VNPLSPRAEEEERGGAVLLSVALSDARPVTIRPDAHLHHEQFDVMAM